MIHDRYMNFYRSYWRVHNRRVRDCIETLTSDRFVHISERLSAVGDQRAGLARDWDLKEQRFISLGIET